MSGPKNKKLLSLALSSALLGGCATPIAGTREAPASEQAKEEEPIVTSLSGGENSTSSPGEMSIDLAGSTHRDNTTTVIETSTVEIIESLPNGFTAADGEGGWLIVGPLGQVDFNDSEECANVLRGIVRDHRSSHPDFNNDAAQGSATGIVESTLGDDRKPVLGDPQGKVVSGETFGQWFSNGNDLNQVKPYAIDIWLKPDGEKFVFSSHTFFPLVGMGFSSDCGDCDWADQGGFSFTTELHTSFEYKGGEVFHFSGDDDVWIFINNQLVVDLGGLHVEMAESIEVDTLGLTIGEVYPLDFFHAERMYAESHFTIETTLDFSDCGEILEVDEVVVR